MDVFTRYSVSDWIYSVLTSVVGAIIFAAAVLAFRWLWRRIASFSKEYRRADQTNRIVKIYVYRRHVGRKTIQSFSRGEFFVVVRCLQHSILGVIFAIMGYILSWIVNLHLVFVLFLALTVYLFFEGAMWLNPQWANTTLENIDDDALTKAAEILGETPDEVRRVITQVLRDSK